jgi:hypothetical protein
MRRKMTRTTIMAPDDLLDELRAIAKEEGVSLGEVMRQGLELRARSRRRRLRFIGAVASGDGPHETAARHEEILYGWRS